LIDQILYVQSAARNVDYVGLFFLIFVMLYVLCYLRSVNWTLDIIYNNMPVKPSDQSGIQIIESNPGRQLCGHQVSVPVTCRPLRAARCSVSLTCRGSTTPPTVTRLHLRHQVLWAGDVSAYTPHIIHGFKLLSLLPFSIPHNKDDDVDDDDDDNDNNNNNRQGLYVINSLRPGLVLWIPVWLFFGLRRLDSAICRHFSSLQTMLIVECVSFSTVLMMKKKRKVRTIGKVGEGGSES